MLRNLCMAWLVLVCVLTGPRAHAEEAGDWQEGEALLKDFRFRSGEQLPALRIHYLSRGAPQRNAAGQVDNVVMILHGTGNCPPASRDTRGHGSYVWAALWKNRLAELLATGP